LTFSVRRKLLAARTLLPSGENVELPGTSGTQRLRSADESGKRAAREDEEDEEEDEGEGEGAPSLDGSRAEDTGQFYLFIYFHQSIQKVHIKKEKKKAI
jgi:hypothetical protein